MKTRFGHVAISKSKEQILLKIHNLVVIFNISGEKNYLHIWILSNSKPAETKEGIENGPFTDIPKDRS